MKGVIILFFLFTCLISAAQKIELTTAKFITGDSIVFSYPSWNDNQWLNMKANTSWDNQGLSGYDGFAWYRFRLVVPLSLKEQSLWKDSLRIYLSKIDDACEVFMNGVMIGKSGSFPDDKRGYITSWNKRQEYHIAANSNFFNWGGENILAVRVYDGGGPGGIFGGIPYVNMIDLIDGIEINTNSPVRFITSTKANKTISVINNSKQKITGTLRYTINDEENDKPITGSFAISLAPDSRTKHSFTFTLAERNNILYQFEESRSHKFVQQEEVTPYILTPKSPDLPKVNSAKVFGVRPGSPFHFKIAATGKKPLHYGVENLPEGLNVNESSGIISGSLKNKGIYVLKVSVKNSLGETKKELTVKCGGLLSLTPPMGWNSWNCWGLSVSEAKLKASAKALINKGLIDHGWTYMNIDDGWESAARNEKGEIIANKKFPDMKKLGDWLHNNGLRFGIYSSPGPETCGGYLGSYRHEVQDATQYSGWGIDYLKYDWCSFETIHDKNDTSLASYQKPYRVMQEALQNQNRDIVYSLCQYGMKNVWEWGAAVNGNCWRTTGDINDTWESLIGIGFNQSVQYPYAGPGRWNDPDMMIIGQVGWGDQLHQTRLTPDEQYTHVSLWCLLSAPLLIGCDLAKLDDFTLNLLTNDEVIAIDQDPLGKQAQQLLKTDSSQVWVKELEDGSKAIGIFNLNEKTEIIRFYWNNLSLSDSYRVRDLWRQKDLGNYKSMFATKVAPHGVTLIRIIPD